MSFDPFMSGLESVQEPAERLMRRKTIYTKPTDDHISIDWVPIIQK